MLIEFSVANFRSLQERQTLSLAKAKGQELQSTNTFTVHAANDFELLRSTAIYGPNAGGKTNLLRALRTMEYIVLHSTTRLQHGDQLPVEPFRLSSRSRSQPSEFEIIFIVDGIRYQYGFTATETRIHEEWLLAFPKGRAQHWFARLWDDSKHSYQWEMGSNLSGEKQLWQKSTRDNALFLSTAVNLNSQQLQPIYDWFKKTLRVAEVGGWSNSFSASLCEKKEKQRVIEFLRAADIDIADIEVESEVFDPKHLPDDMPDAVKDELSQQMRGKEFFDIKTIHKTDEGDLIKFDIEDESDGTQRLFSFAGPWLDSLTNGYVLFIDELHDHLHPKLVQFLIQLFHSNETNPNNAQLIFTTHETSILSQEVFRRDQIWFCEKDKHQASVLYPLTDFSPRKGRENLELAYLSGRYGALPFIQPLHTANGAGH